MSYILGIETSCDDTALGLLNVEKKSHHAMAYSQIKDHAAYGGVMPSLAGKLHGDKLPLLLESLLAASQVPWQDVQAIGVTVGPGLKGSLLMGLNFAKGLSLAHNLPLVGVHHLEAHGLTPGLAQRGEETLWFPERSPAYPCLMFIMSGGHCQCVLGETLGHYTLLGTTLDDAPGECLDKVARLLKLPYPGGKYIEHYAREGDPCKVAFPKPLARHKGGNFSFSGLKTAGRNWIQAHLTDQDLANPESSQLLKDFCASFQASVAHHLGQGFLHGLLQAKEKVKGPLTVSLGGGVIANQFILDHLSSLAQTQGASVLCPPISLCGDNGLMIAWAAHTYLQDPGYNWMSRWSFSRLRDQTVFPRWPLEGEIHPHLSGNT